MAVALTMVGMVVVSGCGTSVEVDPAVETTEVQTAGVAESADAKYMANVETSNINWIGYKPGGQQAGTMKISDGMITVDAKNVPTSGSFTMDINSIKAEDAELTEHLLNEDFFNAPKYPTAKFEITGATATEISGNLTMLGQTHNVTFPYTFVTEGDSLRAQAKFNIDRTKWGIRYASESLIKGLGDTIIKDEFTIELDVAFAKSA